MYSVYMKMIRYNLWIDKELLKDLHESAKVDQRSVSDYMRVSLRKVVKETKDKLAKEVKDRTN